MSVQATLNPSGFLDTSRGADQLLPRAIWVVLENIYPSKDSQEMVPRVERTIRYNEAQPRPVYSAFISYSTEDFLQVQGIMATAMPANLNPRAAMAQAILREYDKETIFRLRPKLSSAIHVDSTITGKARSESVVAHSEKFSATGSHDGRSVFRLKRSCWTILRREP